jgi:hypothetical protein
LGIGGSVGVGVNNDLVGVTVAVRVGVLVGIFVAVAVGDGVTVGVFVAIGPVVGTGVGIDITRSIGVAIDATIGEMGVGLIRLVEMLLHPTIPRITKIQPTWRKRFIKKFPLSFVGNSR